VKNVYFVLNFNRNYRFLFFFLSFGRKNSGEVKLDIEAKMPSEFLGKKNCPYLPSRPQLITNCIFFFLYAICTNVYTNVLHSHVNKRICILQLITFFSRYLAGF